MNTDRLAKLRAELLAVLNAGHDGDDLLTVRGAIELIDALLEPFEPASGSTIQGDNSTDKASRGKGVGSDTV